MQVIESKWMGDGWKENGREVKEGWEKKNM